MLEKWLKPEDKVIVVDGAMSYFESPAKKVEFCGQQDITGLGGAVYDAIVFCQQPSMDVLAKAIEKVYWGGYVVILGISHVLYRVGYQHLQGNIDPVVLRRPPAPPEWSSEFYIDFQLKGKAWNAATKTMDASYVQRFKSVEAKWQDKIVIEYGSGRGEMVRLMALAGAELVFAIDNAKAARELCMLFCDDLENVKAICTDALTWRSPRKAHVIFAADFVEHIAEDDLPKLYKRWFDNARKGCLVHVKAPRGPDAVRDHRSVQSTRKLRRMMQEAGFQYLRHDRPDDSVKFSMEFKKP
jgi:predicted RNA methylase